jgi:hypothetical protein
MSARIMPSVPKQAKHDVQLNEMHDALYSLGDQARTPMGGSGKDLLPAGLAPAEKPGAKEAKKHIHRLHKAFRKAKKEK